MLPRCRGAGAPQPQPLPGPFGEFGELRLRAAHDVGDRARGHPEGTEHERGALGSGQRLQRVQHDPPGLLLHLRRPCPVPLLGAGRTAGPCEAVQADPAHGLRQPGPGDGDLPTRCVGQPVPPVIGLVDDAFRRARVAQHPVSDIEQEPTLLPQLVDRHRIALVHRTSSLSLALPHTRQGRRLNP